MTTENNLATNPLNILEHALSKAPNAIFVLEGTDLRVAYANEALLDLWGKDKAILGRALLEVLPELHDQEFTCALKRVIQSGESYCNKEALTFINKNNTRTAVYLDCTATPIAGSAGTDASVIVFAKNITEEVLEKNSLRADEESSDILRERLEKALLAGKLGYYELDLGTGKVAATSQFKSIFGFSANANVTRADIFNAILPEYHFYVNKVLEDSFKTGGVYNPEYRIKKPDGSIRWIKSSGYARYNSEGQPHTIIGISTDVTDAKIAEEKQAVLASIVDSSDDAIVSKTLNGIITSWNNAAERVFGYTKEETIGKHISLLIPEDRLQEEDMIISSVREGIKVDHFETVRRTKDGDLIPVSLTVSPIKNREGEIIGASKIARDIRETKKAEEKQAVLAAIVDSSDDAILSKTLQGYITSWNKSAERMFGYTAEEAIGEHISLLIPKERLGEEDMILSNIRSGNKIDHFETIRVNKKGQFLPISLSVSPIKDKDGKIIGASKIARDISASKKAEENQAMLAAIVNTSDDAILSKTLQGIITSWNHSAEKLFGYTAEEAIGKHISMLIPPALLDEEDLIISNIARGRKVDHFETIRIAKSGRKLPLSITVSPIIDNDGKVIGASKIARDISGKKEAEEALERYTQNLEIINSMAKTISEELDLHHILQKVTDATTSLIGAQCGAFFYKNEDEQGQEILEATYSGKLKGMAGLEKTISYPPIPREKVITRLDDISSDPEAVDYTQLLGLGEAFRTITSYLEVPVLEKNGSIAGWLVYGHQERGKFNYEHESLIVGISLQAAIALDNAKLYEEVSTLNAKKDEFIGLASHELKTPLTSMTGYLQILERHQKDELSKSFVNKTIEKAGKLTALVSDLLDISKIEAGKLQLNVEKFDIRAVVNEAIELIQLSMPSHQVILESSVECFTVEGDKQRIEQVIVNLLTNAIKYSPAADKVLLTLDRTDQGVRIAVKDYGIGIAKDKQSNIFSRFYRVDGLSPHMSGLGIGLYITREIVERHHGKILVQSEPGSGSTFSFILPEKQG